MNHLSRPGILSFNFPLPGHPLKLRHILVQTRKCQFVHGDEPNVSNLSRLTR